MQAQGQPQAAPVEAGGVKPQAAVRGDLFRRVGFVIVALLVYRLGTRVPLPGLDFRPGRVLGFLFLGETARVAILALGIWPYITASVFMQLLIWLMPRLTKMTQSGGGRRQINQYIRALTVLLAASQANDIVRGLEQSGALVPNPGPLFHLTTIATLVTGTMFLVWLSDEITRRRLGNGVLLILFAGIIASAPAAATRALVIARDGMIPPGRLFWFGVLMLCAIGGIVFIEQARRRILVQFPKREAGNPMFPGASSALPLKLNSAGVAPPYFAAALLAIPYGILSFSERQAPEWLINGFMLIAPGQPLHIILYILGVVFFTFYFTAIASNPQETADNLEKYGGFIPGIRPGPRTAEYIDYVLSRITVADAAYLAAICVLPEVLALYVPYMPFYFGGFSLLVVVIAALDFLRGLHLTQEPAERHNA